MNKSAKTDHNVHKLIAERWSPRVFSNKEISDQELLSLFEAARWAASSMNEQPWRFLYARKGSPAYRKFFECLAQFNQQWVMNAPVLIITVYKKSFSSGKENFHAQHDLGLAMGNFSLQAQSMGIAVHHMAGLDWKKVHDIFGIDMEAYHVTTAVAVGYYGGDIDTLPDDLAESERAPRSRKPLKDLAFENSWPGE